jgi:pimeloyl-ACP methyl ester carboxylesterase
VLLSHIVGSASEDFIVNGPELSPAYFLANSGYDVWMINFRGNFHSRRHVEMNPNTVPEFWDYTLDDNIEDYRATIEFIIQLTGYSQVAVVGYGHGAATMMMALSDDPEWFTPRVNVFVALAPTTTSQHTTNLVFSILFNIDIMERLSDYGIAQVTERSCFNVAPPTDTACRLIVGTGSRIASYADDYIPNIDNFESLNRLMTYLIAGTNLNPFIQYGQMRRASK